MELVKPVGRGASARKYDILSAMMAFALGEDKTTQRQVMRLMCLVTTRYNWQRDELCMGQREIARLWSVDERTVKREMAKLRSKGWLILKRQGARGRVSIYGIDLSRIMTDTREAWPRIGEDYIMRVGQGGEPPPPSTVVPLRPVAAPAQDGTLWAGVKAQLHGSDPSTFANWFDALTQVSLEDGRLTLTAPTRFHARFVTANHYMRLLAACKMADPSIADLKIEAD